MCLKHFSIVAFIVLCALLIEIPSAPPPSKDSNPVLLFDGVCNLCNGFVNFIIERDSEKVFKFCSIQSKEGKEILDRLNATGYYHNLSSVVLVENNTHLFVKSTAALRTVALLDYPYPKDGSDVTQRDTVYEFIATHRYSMFGKEDKCRVPSDDIKSRFLDFCPSD